jgi:hypothetical protein
LFRRFEAVGSLAAGEFDVSLAAVGVKHIEGGSRWRSEKLGDNFGQFMEIVSVFLLDFEHADKHRGYFLTELFLDALQFFHERVESDLKSFKVIDRPYLLSENDLDQ